MDKFGIRFKEERKKKNLTQQGLASLFHLDKSSISRYENGHQVPEMETLIKLSNFFEVSIDYLLGKTDNRNSDTDLEVSVGDNFGKRLKQLMDSRNISAMKLSEDLNIHRGSLSNWETGKRKPDSEMLLKIANYFDVSVDYLLGNENKTDDTDLFNLKGDVSFLKKVNESEMVKIPVLGVIKAGIPMFAEENIIGYEYVHQEELLMGEEYFYLQIKGDSMINAGIPDGSKVLVKKQNFIENNGEIMAVRVNGDEATLKRVYKQKDGLVLQSENPKYAPMFFPATDINTGYVGIIGKAIKVEINL